MCVFNFNIGQLYSKIVLSKEPFVLLKMFYNSVLSDKIYSIQCALKYG